jgi:hypothetical protein
MGLLFSTRHHREEQETTDDLTGMESAVCSCTRGVHGHRRSDQCSTLAFVLLGEVVLDLEPVFTFSPSIAPKPLMTPRPNGAP